MRRWVGQWEAANSSNRQLVKVQKSTNKSNGSSTGASLWISRRLFALQVGRTRPKPASDATAPRLGKVKINPSPDYLFRAPPRWLLR